MHASTEREKVLFPSGDTTCAAWHYPGSNGAAVVMAAGFGVTKEPGTDRFAQRFHDAGFTVLAFDFRHLGESGGRPRQVVRLREQLADWQAAIEFARTLPGVDPSRLAIWGFSSAGGQIFPVAARNPQLAAAIAQTPNADGAAAGRNALRHTTLWALLRLTGRALLYNIYLSGDDIVVVQLALQGTHEGPLEYPFGTIPATGKRMDAPCCDVFQLVDGKIQRFDCYPSGTVILSQLGVLTDLEAVVTQ